MRRWFSLGFPWVAIALILLLAVGLYKAKTDAQEARRNVRQLTHDVRDARAVVRDLRAEVAHLESPARVEQLAQENLEVETGAEARRLPEGAMDEALPAPDEPPR